MVRNVLSQANIDAKDVGFFEAHGTGTRVGDPIEAKAIYKALSRKLDGHKPLNIGSVKSNVGHLENASGIISVMKAALMLEKGFIVPNADFEKENPAIPLSQWNLKVSQSREAPLRPYDSWSLVGRMLIFEIRSHKGSSRCLEIRRTYVSTTSGIAGRMDMQFSGHCQKRMRSSS